MKSAVLLSSVLLMACGSLLTQCGHVSVPDKPEIEVCFIDSNRMALACHYAGGLTPRPKTTLMSYVNYVQKARSFYWLPVEEADKFVSFSPDAFQALSEYMKELRVKIEKQCN